MAGIPGLESVPMDVLLWISIAVILLIIEIITVGFFCLFFAIGAAATASVAYFLPDTGTQVMLFVGISLLTLAFARPLLKKALNISEKPLQDSNAKALIGQTALVLEAVHRHGGKVKVASTGELWSAYLELDNTSAEIGIQPPQEVIIVNVDGAKLAVKAKV